MKGLEKKRVLVTGGSSSIGRAIAESFAAYGAQVAINYYRDSDRDEADAIRQSFATKRTSQDSFHDLLIQADVSQEASVKAMFEQVNKEWGGLDILVNNAGIQIASDSHDADIAHIDRVLSTNLRGSFMCAKQALQIYLAQEIKGVILNVSSVHEVIPRPRFVGYAMSKGGMHAMTTTLALEYAAHGIRVNAIAPGATITAINDAWIHDPEKKAEVESHIPLGRSGTAEEMGEISAFLCSEHASYITGQTLFVDGGLTLYADFRSSWSGE